MSTLQPRGDRDPECTLSTHYTLTVEGITTPTTHDTLDSAVHTLRALLGSLPLDAREATALDLLLGKPCRIADFITRDGTFTLAFTASGRPYVAEIRPDSIA